MENTKILTYGDVKVVKAGGSDEKLVRVQKYDNSIIAQYEKFDMVAYTSLDILIRETVAQKLAMANKKLQTNYDLSLKVVYGYRALEVQTAYFNTRQTELAVANPGLSAEALAALTHNFVAVPGAAGHVTGGAVDITLVDSHGVSCDMGTKIADYTDEDRIKTFSAAISVEQRQHRRILLDEMMAVGFAPFLGEWWHFSYGDKEWAAFYKKQRALYGPVPIQKTAKVFEIAGGNKTVIQTIKDISGTPLEQAGKALMDVFPEVEQSGFLDVSTKKFEMAGGEFCGNASAAAAVILSNEHGMPTVSYTASGFEGHVRAHVERLAPDAYQVRTSFYGMSCEPESISNSGHDLKIVDMGGIVHILIEEAFPADNYESIQRSLINDLELHDREAVGVIWYKQIGDSVYIDPVVWVNKVDTLYYETACGSGSIAASLCTGVTDIFQPTKNRIRIYASSDAVTTECLVLQLI
jgi:D-alanyl-D-alanine dipeptidase/diaminopimelate epimerase